MAKALRLMEEQLNGVDFVIECRDGRAPNATRNPVIAKRLGSKPRIVIMTKKDLCDLTKTQVWVKQLEAEGSIVLVVDVLNDNVRKLLNDAMETVLKPKREREARRGIKPRTARALIVGVPNVGKSTLINMLVKKKVASVENRPGVTQSLKLIKISDFVELVDTPGVLWPKFETEEQGIRCALVGSVRETGYPIDLVVNYALNTLHQTHGDRLVELYGTNQVPNFYQNAGRHLGLLELNGVVDEALMKKRFLQDVQNGVVGRITWD